MTAEQQIARARQVFDIEIEGLARTKDSLGESFARAISLMRGCMEDGGIVVVSGVGKSLHVAEKMSAIFSSTGTKSIVLNPVQAMHGDLGMLQENDLLLALSYSGRSELVDTAKQIARKAANGQLNPDDIDESTIQKHLYHPEIPDVDLLIRTGGDLRVSNFLLWEIAYAELFFSPIMWPDFRKEHLREILDQFSHRERRFGKTGEQVRAH